MCPIFPRPALLLAAELSSSRLPLVQGEHRPCSKSRTRRAGDRVRFGLCHHPTGDGGRRQRLGMRLRGAIFPHTFPPHLRTRVCHERRCQRGHAPKEASGWETPSFGLSLKGPGRGGMPLRCIVGRAYVNSQYQQQRAPLERGATTRFQARWGFSHPVHRDAMGKRVCRMEGCSKMPRAAGCCIAHGGGKLCQHAGCTKSARGAHCKAHGGGRRCLHRNCTKSAQGGTDRCIAHGGGRRCQEEDCAKSAQGGTDFCKAHGGGSRCQHEGCLTAARDSSGFCKAHGGGRRCQTEGCPKSARDVTGFCIAHGRYQLEGDLSLLVTAGAAMRMAESGTRSRRRGNAPYQPTERASTRASTSRTVEAGAASTTAAPVQLVPEGTVDRTAGGASSGAAPSQLDPGRRTAEDVHPAHSSSSRRAVRRRIEPQT